MRYCVAHVRHLFVHLCTRSLSSGAIQSGIGSDNFIDELTHGFLILAMGLEKMYEVKSNPFAHSVVILYLLEVGTVVARCEPGRLSIRN